MPDPLQKPKRQKPNAVEGTALVIVLSCLVLLAALAISLLNRVESDRSSSASYRGGTQTKNLADYAINVVMAQINTATADPALAWASQPGAIRTYSATGSNLVNIHKLYSSTNMVTNAFPASDITALANWAASPALFTDLNAPIITKSGSSTNTNYPILDPGATNSVQGFAISGAPTSTIQPAPMPVNWLYVLQDGNLVAPSGGSGNTTTVTGATSSNPIIGRIAFWADDETCKININTAAGAPWSWATNNPNTGLAPLSTAGGGTTTTTLLANYWDVPMFGSYQDNNLAYSQPWRGEYQRFPGHPATVSLSAVFTNLSSTNIMDIVPRIAYSSSGANVGSQWGATLTTNYSSNNIISSDGARLYANVDELLYATNRSSTGTNPISAMDIDRGRFFLTAASRAPDITMFNTPRLLCWPVNTDTSKLTPYDQLIAFDGTVGPNTDIGSTNSYYFTRSNPYSSTVDYQLPRNQQLMIYLRNLTQTAVPGFGGSSGILGKYGIDSGQIRTEIFDYIRCINLQDTSMNTNSYYYSTNGLVVPTIDSAGTFGYGRFPTVSKVGLLFWYGQNGTASPVFTNIIGGNPVPNTYTNQTCKIISRFVMETFNPALGNPAMTNISPTSGGGYSNVVTGLTNNTEFQWGPLTNAMTNIFTNNTPISYQEDNVAANWFYIAGRRSIVTSTNTLTTAFATDSPDFVRQSYIFSNGTLQSVPGNSTIFSGPGNVTTSSGNWTYVSGNTTNTLPASGAVYFGGSVATKNYGTFFFTGGNVSISTYYNGTVVQSISNINLPGTNLEISLPTYNSANTTYNTAAAWGISGNGSKRGDPTTSRAIWTNDVVLSAQIASGDFRMSRRGGTPNNGNVYFTNHPMYFNATNNATIDKPWCYAHSFVPTFGGAYSGSSVLFNAYYQTNATFYTNNSSTVEWPNGDMVANSTNGGSSLLMRYGDFDNGYGSAPDGPYIGFCEEGTTSTNANAANVGNVPYFPQLASTIQTNLGPGFFSPNRLVPSAGVMGSLPTGVNAGNPWQTLLFRPSALTGAGHPGANNPPDYLLLDLFNMPVVEPYAISEPLSTAGRVNMNYQILPFTWIKRSTALQAVLHIERITAFTNSIPTPGNINKRKSYNMSGGGAANINITNRFTLDLNTNTGTLRGFEDRFASNDIFRSAAEICSIPLVPYGAGANYATMSSWWMNHTYTGENSKERPYARIYPKLTTKSNTYTVHYRVEVLKQRPGSTPTTWTEGADKVISTYRGSTTIERYVNPRDPSIPNYASQSLPLNSTNALPYKFRILADRHFNP